MTHLKTIVLLIPFINLNLVFGQSDNLFSTLVPDSIVIYDYDYKGKGQFLSIIDQQGQLAPTVKKSARLDKQNERTISQLLDSPKSYGQATAACFEPHHGIVFYKNKQVLAHITICIECNRLVSSTRIKAQEQGKQGVGKEVYYILDGMSKSFRYYFNSLLMKYHFSHQIKGASMFD